MSKTVLKLQPSEAVVVQAAAQIYSAYIIAGHQTLETETDYVERSVEIAIRIAARTDELVRSDSEMS